MNFNLCERERWGEAIKLHTPAYKFWQLYVRGVGIGNLEIVYEMKPSSPACLSNRSRNME